MTQSAMPKAQRNWLLAALAQETTSGILLFVSALVAIMMANSSLADFYFSSAHHEYGFAGLHLSLAHWVSDGLLTIFFFVVGLELKHELTIGSLANPKAAAIPMVAAIFGMVVPAGLYLAVTLANSAPTDGWGIPMATDIAFALAVLALVGRKLPIALRAFLLTLAVVDDLGAILAIAIFYTEAVSLTHLLISVVALGLWRLAIVKGKQQRWLLSILALSAWYFMLGSGVHATVAGVALGLLVPVNRAGEHDTELSHRLVAFWHPWSAGIVVPLYAYFASGVSLGEVNVGQALENPVGRGVFLGLLVGKPVGVLLGAALTARVTKTVLSTTVKWIDIAAVAVLTGVGFTVALLISELAFDGANLDLAAAKLAVLCASLLSGLIAGALLYWRVYRDYRH
jgi:NhaA family Na+:H+ antiporter